MSKKKVKTVVKLQISAGKATPAPPVGTALGPHGIDIMGFCRQYNEQTAPRAGTVVPAEITIFEDRTFTFVLKTPPAAELLKKAATVDKGSATPNRVKAGSISKEQLREIAEAKLADLNAHDVVQAMSVIEGTARSMGITVRES